MINIKEIDTIQADQRTWSVDWHPNTKLIASVGCGKTITLWKQKQGKWKQQQKIQTQHTKTIRVVRFSHSGQFMAIGSFDSFLSVWVLNQGSYELLSTMEGHENEVKCVNWSPNDKKIASCSRDKNIWIWEFDSISTQYVCENVLEGHTQDVKYVDWISNEKVISCSYDNSIRVWEMQDDDFICSQVLSGHNSIVWCLAFELPNLISVGQDQNLILWKMNQQGKFQAQKKIENLHSEPIYTCATFQNYFLTGSGDNDIKMIDKEGNILWQGHHQNDVNSVRVGRKEWSMFCSCSDDETIKIWSLEK